MIKEDQLEQLAIRWFQDTGWSYANSADLAPEGAASERADFRTVVLKARLATAVQKLNAKLPPSAVEEVVHVVTTPTEPGLPRKNRAFHRQLMDDVKVEFTNAKGQKETDHAQLIDFQNPERNDFLVVNQFTVTGSKKPRRPDLVIFVNGLPLGVEPGGYQRGHPEGLPAILCRERPPQADAGAGGEPGAAPRDAVCPAVGRHSFYHHSEVLPAGGGKTASGPVRAHQRGGDLRRGPPQPIRTQGPARRTACGITRMARCGSS